MESGSESIDQTTAASEIRRVCDPCRERGDTTPALKLCLDCQEASGADFFTSFTKCLKHPERDVEFYCNDTVFCAVCGLTDHDKTCEIADLAKYEADAIKLKEESEKLNVRMRDALEKIQEFNTSKGKTKNDLKTKLKEIREEIEQVRDQVATMLDNVVKHVSEITKKIELETDDRLDEEIAEVSKLKQLTEEQMALMDKVRKHGSDKHQFISAHLMQLQLKDIERKISEEDKRMRNIDAELNVAGDIRKLMENIDVEKLVEVTVIESKRSHKHLESEPNYLRDRQLIGAGIHMVHPNDGCYPQNNGISVHKDGRIIICDQCNGVGCGYLCLYNQIDKTMMKLKLNQPCSATQIDDTHLAVSIPDEKAIKIVAVSDKLTVEKTIKTQNKPGTIIALSDGRLAVAWTDPVAFGIVDISGTKLKQISYFEQDKNTRKLESFKHMAVDEKRQHVIQPCRMDKALYCFDFTGEPVFKYTDKDQRDLEGVALDKCGNIYACECRDPGIIHKLSPTGEPIWKLTCPSWPSAICSDNAGTGFWVTRAYAWFIDTSDKVMYLKLEQNTE